MISFLKIALCISIMIFISCSENVEMNSVITDPVTGETYEVDYHCLFEQNDDSQDGRIDDDERAIMEDCMQSRITEVDELRNNLIGEWELIGHGEGWVSNISQPCGYMIFMQDKLIFQFENSWTDTVVVYDNWSVIEHDNGSVGFITEKDRIVGMSVSQYCENYMFGDATPLDGNMYLYEKKK